MEAPAIIYEEEHFLAVNKPAGLLVHGTKVSREPTLAEWIVKKYPEVGRVGDDPKLRPGIVHRLDKETSGVMVVARDQKYFEYLKSLFQNRKVEKTYLALVAGRPPERQGIIAAPIGIRNGTIKRSIRSEKMAKSAVTEYKVLKTFIREGAHGAARGNGGTFSLLEVHPKTGRTHQIRVHLASIGNPVVGDTLYGPKKQPPWARRLMLHALSLEFTAADGKRMKFEAEPPEDLRSQAAA